MTDPLDELGPSTETAYVLPAPLDPATLFQLDLELMTAAEWVAQNVYGVDPVITAPDFTAVVVTAAEFAPGAEELLELNGFQTCAPIGGGSALRAWFRGELNIRSPKMLTGPYASRPQVAPAGTMFLDTDTQTMYVFAYNTKTWVPTQ